MEQYPPNASAGFRWFIFAVFLATVVWLVVFTWDFEWYLRAGLYLAILKASIVTWRMATGSDYPSDQ